MNRQQNSLVPRSGGVPGIVETRFLRDGVGWHRLRCRSCICTALVLRCVRDPEILEVMYQITHSLAETETVVTIVLDLEWPTLSGFIEVHEDGGSIDLDVRPHQMDLVTVLRRRKTEVDGANVFQIDGR